MPSDGERIAHHDLCFGCGLANPFGLQLELRDAGGGELRGRFFVKQDHQGAGGVAHAGVLASALAEAMALVVGAGSVVDLQLELSGVAPVGTYVEVSARRESSEGHRAVGELRASNGVIGRATASFTR